MIVSASLTFFDKQKGFLIINENRYISRTSAERVALFNPIGGKLEEGDGSLLDCAVREFIEETNFSMKKDDIIFEIFNRCIYYDQQVTPLGNYNIKYHRFIFCDIDLIDSMLLYNSIRHIKLKKFINTMYNKTNYLYWWNPRRMYFHDRDTTSLLKMMEPILPRWEVRSLYSH